MSSAKSLVPMKPLNQAKANPLLAQKSRIWEVIVYGESEADQRLLAWLQSDEFLLCDNIAYVACFHDQDITEEGLPKKPHYHVLFRFSNPRSMGGVAKALGVALNQIGPVHSWRSACRYLVHADQPDKHQYDESGVFGTLQYEAVRYIRETKFDIKSPFVAIFDILSSHFYSEYSQFMAWLIDCGCEYVETFRKNIMVFQPYIKQLAVYRKEYNFYETEYERGDSRYHATCDQNKQ